MSVSLDKPSMIDGVLPVWLNQPQGYGIKSAGHDIPVAVIRDFSAFEVGNIGIFEVTPDDAAAVHFGEVVSRQRGNLDTEGVLAGKEVRSNVQQEGGTEERTGIVAIDIYMRRLADSGQVK